MNVTFWSIRSNGFHAEGDRWMEAKVLVEKVEVAELMDQLHRDLRGMEYARMDEEEKTGMRIIALDLGTFTGWAIIVPGGTESGTQKFDMKRGESPGMRYVRFRKWLSDLIDDFRPDMVAYEIPHMRGGYASEFLHGLTTRVHEICADRGINHQGVHTGTLKKFCTGTGAAKKHAMWGAATSLFPSQEVTTEDQADALCVLHWAMETLDESSRTSSPC